MIVPLQESGAQARGDPGIPGKDIDEISWQNGQFGNSHPEEGKFIPNRLHGTVEMVVEIDGILGQVLRKKVFTVCNCIMHFNFHSRSLPTIAFLLLNSLSLSLFLSFFFNYLSNLSSLFLIKECRGTL